MTQLLVTPEAPEHDYAKVVVSVPSFTHDWYANFVDNPNSQVNGGYPIIPAMPRRTRLRIAASLIRTDILAGTGSPGIWLSDQPFGSTSQGMFLPLGYIDVAGAQVHLNWPILEMTHTGPVYAQYSLNGLTGAVCRLAWHVEIDAELPAIADLLPSFLRDRAEGEPEANMPQPFAMEDTKELDDYAQGQEE
jgi:hypothetical protein